MLLIEDVDCVRTIAMNRPEVLNAFNSVQFSELTEAIVEAGMDDEVNVVVLTGTGRAFSSGADLGERGDRRQNPATDRFPKFCHAVIECPKPFALAINGLGVGLGATLCGLADFVFMSESARLRCPFSELGLVAEAASTRTFPYLMGRQRANWFLMSSEWLTADECLEAGLALKVFPSETFMADVQREMAKIARLPKTSLTEAKLLIQGPIRDFLKDAVEKENEALGRLRGAPANVEAITAFREKRPPNFD